jgi:hypothetical protein
MAASGRSPACWTTAVPSTCTVGTRLLPASERSDEVFSPGFAVCGRLREASLQVRPLSQRSVGCRLPGACAEGPRPKSLTTRRSPDQRHRPHPSTGFGFLVRKPRWSVWRHDGPDSAPDHSCLRQHPSRSTACLTTLHKPWSPHRRKPVRKDLSGGRRSARVTGH